MCACCGSRNDKPGRRPRRPSKRPRRGAEEEGLCLFCLEPVRRGAGAGAPAPCRHCRAPMHHECRAKWGCTRRTRRSRALCARKTRDSGSRRRRGSACRIGSAATSRPWPVLPHAARVPHHRGARALGLCGRWPWRSDTLIDERCGFDERLAPGVDAILTASFAPFRAVGAARSAAPAGARPDVTMLTRLPHMDNALPPLGLSTSPPVEVLVRPLHPVAKKNSSAS